jgi:xanthine dehydrogenase YagS FAD-binding subunit
MTPFTYARAADAATAVRQGTMAGAKYLGGGTNLVDLMREGIERPKALIDVTALSATIEEGEGGSLIIGAATKNTTLAADPRIRRRYPVLSRAILAGASAQIRNMATVGGNILQRTRCRYFYDRATACNKREPGAGCDAVGGFNRYHAILGASPACVATNPSDMCVALAALDATVVVAGPNTNRTIAFTDFHRLPGETPERETLLEPGELIVAVMVPALPLAARSTYRKIRDRGSYAFALVSVAAALDLGEDRTSRDIRLALGGLAHKPWRAFAAEAALRGQRLTETTIRAAAEAELAAAVPLRDNRFKIELGKRAIINVLTELGGNEP